MEFTKSLFALVEAGYSKEDIMKRLFKKEDKDTNQRMHIIITLNLPADPNPGNAHHLGQLMQSYPKIVESIEKIN